MPGLGDRPPYSPAFPPQEFTIYAVTVEKDRAKSLSQKPTNEDEGTTDKNKRKDKRVKKNSAEARKRSDGIEDDKTETESLAKTKKDGNAIVIDEYDKVYGKSSQLSTQDPKPRRKTRTGNEDANVLLNMEYVKIRHIIEKRDKGESDQVGLDAHPDNTGFWIFGAGHAYVLPHKFNDPYYKAKFVSRIIFVYFICLLWRSIWLQATILQEDVHDYLYEIEAYWVPLIVCFCIYLFTVILTMTRFFMRFLKLFPVVFFLFLVQECMRTACYCLFSLAFEYIIISWYDTLDIFDDYNPNEPGDRNYWKQLVVTPPIMFLIMAAGITLNLFTALCMELYTDMKLGSPEMFRATIVISLMCFLVTVILIRFYSVGLIPMWDGFQVALGITLCVVKTWIFLYNLQRLVTGKIVFLEGMTYKDALYGLLLIA